MRQEEKSTVQGRNRLRNTLLLIMITVLTLYIAVPIYGVIHDSKEGTVFVIEGTGEGNGLLDKVIDFLFSSEEIKIPTAYVVDVRGTVLYTDKTPYSNGIVELRSTPRYTRTDQDGCFIFKAVEAGRHVINVIDASGKTLASCNVEISTDEEPHELYNTSFSEGTYKISVAVNVEVLEIRLTLKTDENGDVQGISNLEVVKAETKEPVPPDGVVENEPDESGEEPDESGEKPGKSDDEPTPPDTGGKSPSGGGGGGPVPQPFTFEVYDSGNSSAFGKGAAAQINIFGNEKRIAPGMKGSYRFTVDNRLNMKRSLYTVDFISSDTLPAGKKIPIVFRLKAGNTYVAGDAGTWCPIIQLSQDAVLEGKDKVVYTLEWYWPETVNDNIYKDFANDPDYSYTLRIEVTAQQE